MLNCLTPEEAEIDIVLGIIWYPGRDSFKFSVRINLSPLKKKLRVGPDLIKEVLLTNLPVSISRRKHYSQVQALFDPTVLLSPALLQEKDLYAKHGKEIVRNSCGTVLCLNQSLKK